MSTVGTFAIGTESFGSSPAVQSTPPLALVVGREYRTWLDYPGEYTAVDLPIVDFIIARVPSSSTAPALLPIGSLTTSRFYYGETENGKVDAAGDTSFRPLWLYPTAVAMAATPWVRWGAGNRWQNGATGPDDGSRYGFANDVYNPHVVWSPGIGLKGEGTCIVAMQLNDVTALNLPFPTKIDRWFFHYSEVGNVPQNDIIADIAGGPMNPYMVVAHQGRVVMPDRRRTAAGIATTSLALDHGSLDDLVFYSDYQLPTQSPLTTALTTDKGVANGAYGEFVQASMHPYNRMTVAEDIAAGFGTVGVVTLDQILLVKHFGGGALISGDLDNPSHHRLPYIESTGGVTCKGVHTPAGFVYGSRNGIFVWQGGDTTQHLSPQLDEFFWDHTSGDDLEAYAGCRGRFGYWNGLVCVPNNYVFDLATQSWWRFKVPDLLPVSAASAAFNCYDVDESGRLYAFPYRHAAPLSESSTEFPASASQLNALSIPDAANFSAPTQLDIRFAIDNVAAGSGIRTIVSHYQVTGDQRSYWLTVNASDQLEVSMSTSGAAGTVQLDTCDVALTAVNTPILGRMTWRSSDGRIQFFSKAPGEITSQMRSNFGWTQLGADEVGHTAALFNSTENLVIGNLGDDGLSGPYIGRIYALSIATTIDGAPVVEILPRNIPVDEQASSFTAESGQTVTVTRAGAGPALTLNFEDQTTPPVWYTFDDTDLDNEYSWQSHPLVQTRGRITAFQAIELLATGCSETGDPATVDVTLEGFDRKGAPVTSRTTTFNLAASLEPQLLRRDITTNFQAEYVTVRLRAFDPNGNPAPKIHSVKLAVKPRARTPRHG